MVYNHRHVEYLAPRRCCASMPARLKNQKKTTEAKASPRLSPKEIFNACSRDATHHQTDHVTDFGSICLSCFLVALREVQIAADDLLYTITTAMRDAGKATRVARAHRTSRPRQR